MAGEIENDRPKGLLILFTSFKLLNILDDKAFRHVITAMAAYVEKGEEPEGLEPIEQLAFESQREALDGNIQTYRKTAAANRENGRKGGRPRKPKETDGFSKEAEKTDGFSEKPMETRTKPNETHENQKLRIKNYSDTDVSDISTVVVKQNGADSELAQIVQRYESSIGKFPRSALEKLQGWREVFSVEMILLAIDKAAEASRRSWNYVDGILRNWKHEGIRTPGDAAASDEQYQSRQQQGNRAGNARKPAEDVGSQLDRVLAKMDKERGFEP